MAWVIERTGVRGTRYTGAYRDSDGRTRSAGSYPTRREAARAAQREEQKVLAGAWHDHTPGQVTFRDYVTGEWLPNKHLEASTRAAYLSYLNKHFYPFFGDKPLNKISPTLVQDWVSTAHAGGLAPRSIRKYHVMLASIFARAVKDRVLVYNPCDHTELPKIITRRTAPLTPGEYDRLLAAIPSSHQLMVQTFIEAGLRWGELVALKPRHIDFLRRTLTIEETIVEVSKAYSPTGQRYLVKPYLKDNEPRTLGVRQTWLDDIAAHIHDHGIGRDDLLFPTTAGTPISRNTFRTRIWLPALKTANLGHHVRIHDLRHAHATWLLAGGADLTSVMERMGHTQIQTTQKYLHTLPNHDQRNLDALNRTQHGSP